MHPKLARLAFYLWMYCLPAMVALSQPGHWVGAVLTVGLAPGMWRAVQRSLRRGRVETLDLLMFSSTSAVVSLIVAGVSSVLGWLSLPCWVLVGFEQAHRRERQRNQRWLASTRCA